MEKTTMTDTDKPTGAPKFHFGSGRATKSLTRKQLQGPLDVADKAVSDEAGKMNAQWAKDNPEQAARARARMDAKKQKTNEEVDPAVAAVVALMDFDSRGQGFRPEEFEAAEADPVGVFDPPRPIYEDGGYIAEVKGSLGDAMKSYKRMNKTSWDSGDPRDLKKRLKKETPERKKELAGRTGKLHGPAELQRRLAKKMTKESVEEPIDELSKGKVTKYFDKAAPSLMNISQRKFRTRNKGVDTAVAKLGHTPGAKVKATESVELSPEEVERVEALAKGSE